MPINKDRADLAEKPNSCIECELIGKAACPDHGVNDAEKPAPDDIDAAYKERNQVVAALAKCFPSGIAKTAIDGWDESWHNCVYIDLPTGQTSWHYHDRDAYLFEGLPQYLGSWDGHSTPEKYERLHAIKTAPDDADCKKAREILERLCSGHGHDVTWRMSIPAQEDDSDIVLSRIIDRAAQSQNKNGEKE